MRFLYTLVLLGFIILWSSCRNDFEAIPSTGNLEFSRDTVYLDTVFTNIGSSTHTFTVYNRSNEDIEIPSIRLGQGENSNYRLNVDGIPGKSFDNIQILAKDSIFVFVETTADISTLTTSETEFLYTDKILFDSGSNEQDVDLVTLIQDAVFLFPSRDAMTGAVETLSLGMDADNNEVRIEGFFLEDEQLRFTNEKPYVIYGYAAVPSNKTLTIDPGARIHFHEESGIIVANEATLLVNGELSSDPDLMENEVIFESDRLESLFSDVPGQWGTIWLTAGSTGHVINHATIKNATVGILMDSNDGTSNPTLTISNTQIYNSSNVGLLARTGNVLGENIVINNSGQVSLNCSLGGRYNFKNSTFANYWTAGSGIRQLPTVLIDNNLQVDAQNIVVADLIEANFTDCIIYGNQNLELRFSQVEGTAFNYNFKNCLIRFNDIDGSFENDPLFNFSDSSLFENSILNEDPDFRDPFNNDFQIGETSAANGNATTPGSGTDIVGKDRDPNAPDIGAYESIMLDPN